jgi:L-rhamnose mutarotase
MPLQRICFQLQVKPGRLAEYEARHAAVWPEMRDALAATGWHNYSLFTTDGGMVIGYVECEDFDAARAAMEQTDVNARWQAEMAEFFTGLDGLRPDEGLAQLREIFHLD